jgi:predicted kinase
MSKLIITRGLSGSGKTTWAKDFCAGDPGFRVRVNRDDLRGMLFGGYVHGHAFEQMVTRIQQDSIRGLLQAGRTVVADDTNLALKHARQFSKLAFEEGAEFDVIDHFLQVPLEECIARDAARPAEKRVGADVIRNQYQRFGVQRGLPPVPPYAPLVDRPGAPYVRPVGPPAYIIDIDGTVALMGDRRGPFDWHAVGSDEPNEAVVEIVRTLMANADEQAEETRFIFLSGRDESCRTETLSWLHKHLNYGSFWGTELHMRPAGDTRRDSIVKLELFNAHVRDKYDVRAVFDDRDQVVEMWRSIGLTCLQVAPGAF